MTGKAFGARFSWIMSGAVVLLVGVSLLSPLVLELALERWFVQRGADSADIADVDLNVLLGTASVEGLEVRLDDRTVLSDSDVDVDLSWAALFEHGIVLERAVLEGVRVEIEVLDDGQLRIGSFLMGSDQTVVNIDEAASNEPWWTRVERLVLRDGVLRFRGHGVHVSVELDEVTMVDISTEPGGKPGSIQAAGRLNGAPMTVDAAVNHVWPADIAGSVSVEGLDLATVSGPLGGIGADLSGSMSASGGFVVRGATDDSVRFEYSGSARLNNARLVSDLIGASGDSVDWQGDLALESSAVDSGVDLQLSGQLEGARLLVELPRRGIRLAQREWLIDGEVKVGRGVNHAATLGAFAGTATDIRLSDSERDLEFVAADKLVADAVRFDGAGLVEMDTLALSAVALSDPNTGDSGPSFKKVWFEGVTLHDSLIEPPRKSRLTSVRVSEDDRRLLEKIAERLGLSID